MNTAPRLYLAAESLTAGSGGIGRVARLMAKVLAEEAQAGRIAARAIALSDPQPAGEFDLRISTARGSRARFLAAVQTAAFTHTHFLYDFLGMARAHTRLLARPFAVWIHGIEIWEQAPASRIATARRADVLIANTEYARTRAERSHGGFARARVCWLGTEADDVPPALPARNGPPTVLTLGRLEPGRDKGQDALIAAWPAVVSVVPDARLLIVGGGEDLQRLRAAAAASAATHRIEVRGFVPEADIPSVWASATAFAMPSRGEGFGLVYIEAMRHGLPVVGSVHDAAPEINVDGETGYNVSLEASDQLPERLIALLRDRDTAARLGDNGRRRWQAHFRFSAFKQRFVPLLHDFLRLH